MGKRNNSVLLQLKSTSMLAEGTSWI